MAQARILIIDDPEGQPMGARLEAILQRESRYRVDLIKGPLPDGPEVLEPRPDLITPVLAASKEKAAQLLAKLRAVDADTPLLPVLRSADLNRMLDELLRWTMDFLITPLRAVEVLARVRRLLSANGEPAQARIRQSVTEMVGLAQLLGEAPAFVAVRQKIPLVARAETPVLLAGETGTGKELCARALHYLSRRAGKPFLPVNCGAIPVELFESELFGCQKGAFTGAWAARPGMIAEAEGGTLFLDEIDTLSLAAQAKLLRFVETGTYHALGSPRLRQADVWILTSTNVALLQKVREGAFREDLFYRLAVLTLNLPPLRERRADIPLLVAHFWERYARRHGAEKRLSSRAMEALCHYAWPGNIRELQNVIQQIVVLTDVQTIEPEHLPIPLSLPAMRSRGASLKQTKAKVIEHFERAYLTELLRVHQGNVTHAAREAKKERRAFGRLIKKYQIAKR